MDGNHKRTWIKSKREAEKESHKGNVTHMLASIFNVFTAKLLIEWSKLPLGIIQCGFIANSIEIIQYWLRMALISSVFDSRNLFKATGIRCFWCWNDFRFLFFVFLFNGAGYIFSFCSGEKNLFPLALVELVIRRKKWMCFFVAWSIYHVNGRKAISNFFCQYLTKVSLHQSLMN